MPPGIPKRSVGFHCVILAREGAGGAVAVARGVLENFYARKWVGHEHCPAMWCVHRQELVDFADVANSQTIGVEERRGLNLFGHGGIP